MMICLEVLNSIPSLVTESMNQHLIASITEIEVREAVFQLGKLKARGPDGFQGHFIKITGTLLRKI